MPVLPPRSMSVCITAERSDTDERNRTRTSRIMLRQVHTDIQDALISSPRKASPLLQQDQRDDGLDSRIAPGDVLYVPGTGGGVFEVGTAGGLLGHVMVAIARPRRIPEFSEDGIWFKPVWPSGGVTEIWMVRVIESTRNKSGLHEANLLLYLKKRTRRIILIGEVIGDHIDGSGQPMELWESPGSLRTLLSAGLLAEVVQEMKDQGTSWSWTTAARAVLRSASSFNKLIGNDLLLQEIMECWAAEPICTSVVIGFWQRCLCKIATGDDWSTDDMALDPAELILKWMPLKADRSLPGTLLETMRNCGWKRWTAIPACR